MNKLRGQLIVNYINEHNYASLNELCEKFIVSPATMRRDLEELDSLGLLTRVHGGAKSLSTAVVNGSSIQLSREQRMRSEPEKKKAIAGYIVTLIKPNDIIFLDSSTTLLYAVDFLNDIRFPITIITNDIFIAAKLGEKSIFNVIVIGGTLRKNGSGTVGFYAEQQISSMNFDKAFISFDAISIHEGISTRHAENLVIKQKIIKNSIQSYAVGDSTKFTAANFGKVCDLDQFTGIITDQSLADDIYNDYLSRNVRLVRV